MTTRHTRHTARAVGYVRVSTDDQAKHGLSLDAQAEEISEYCQRQGLELVHIYREEGKSASKALDKRAAFLWMMGDAGNGAFDVVVVYHIDRFSRDPGDYYPLIERLQAHGVNLVALNDPDFDATDPGHEMKRGIDITVARYQARLSRAKMIDVVRRKLDSGKRNIGQRIPYGLKWADDETKLVHDAETIRVWGLMKDLRRQGWGYARIADALNGQTTVDAAILERHGVTLPVPNRWGMKVWREGAIASMFRDPCRYTGRLEIGYPNRRGEVTKYTVEFPPLLTKAEFDRFAALARRNLTWTPRNVGKGSLLSSLCKCGLCGSTLHVTGSRGSRYYGCAKRLRRPQRGEKRCPLPLIPMARLEKAVLRLLGSFLLDDEAFKRALALVKPERGGRAAVLADLGRQEKRLAAQARAVQGRLERLVKAIEDGAIEGADAKARRDVIRQEQDRLAQRQAELGGHRAGLARKVERVRLIEKTRTLFARIMGREKDLLALPKEAQRDLLRALLPAGLDCGIKVLPSKGLPTYPNARSVPKWRIEIQGLLPVEQAELRKAVLGGGLAVPCTCNPL